MQQSAIQGDVGFGSSLERVLCQKGEVALLSPSLEQVFKGFAHDGFTLAATDLLDDVQLLEVIVDQYLTHGLLPLLSACIIQLISQPSESLSSSNLLL
ncbi:MAG: hypothetical protein ACKOWD_08730 [Rhodoferax sp.]